MPSSSAPAGAFAAGGQQRVDHRLFGHRDQPLEIELAAQQVKCPLQHGRGRAHGVVPIDFAEHHVAGEDHHLGGRLAFVGDRQRVARFVQAQAADEPAAVEVLAVGNAGVQAVAHQVVDFVDVDRPGEHAAENSL